MKAAICQHYGGPEQVEVVEMPDPVPGKGEVLVKVMASTVNSADSRIRSLNVPRGFRLPVRLIFGWSKPKVSLGTELSGEVIAVGEGVSEFQIGDNVFADCGMKMGGHATHRVFKASDPIAKIPNNLSMEHSAAIGFGGSTAMYFLQQKAQVKAGDKVLINGASGAVGCAAIQVAKLSGAEVTAVCSHRNVDLVTSLGADQVIDYEQQAILSGNTVFNVIMDNVGTLSWAQCKPYLSADGKFLGVVADMYDNLIAPFRSMLSAKQYIVGTVMADKTMLNTLCSWVESNSYRPVIDQVFPLSEIQAAYQLVDSGRKKGSVIISMSNEHKVK